MPTFTGHFDAHLQVVLRNVGGQTANLTGYRLTDSDTRMVDAAMVSWSLCVLNLQM